MILRRLAASLKAQNWTAIAIEFVLLVLGVFLGIQVANWNEARNLQQRKAAALERMHDEGEANIAYLQRRIDVLGRDAPARTEALRRLSANDWQGADPARMAAAFDSIGYAPALSPPRGVYDELISTGMFAELGDPRLRDAISSYYASVGYADRQADFVRSGIIANSVGRLHAGAKSTFDPGAFRQVRVVYDFPALSADAAYVAAAVENNAALIAQVQWTTQALESAKTMCAQLARVDGRPCKAGGSDAP